MPFGSLWLPVVVSAVVVFVASSIIHMALKYHRADYKGLSNEDAVREALGKPDPAPGLYFMPYCGDMKQMGDPVMKAKFEKGPVALISIARKGPINLPKHLTLWFGFSLIVSFVAAYVARHTLLPGADGILVMRVTGTIAFAVYGLADMSSSIWKSQPWPNTFRALIDGLIYGVLTGLTFRLLWPAG